MDKFCCVFGHWEIDEKEIEIEEKLKEAFIDLIEKKNVKTFFFGGFGNFDSLCYKVVTELKNKYTDLSRIYVCDDYKYIDRPWKRHVWLKARVYEEFVYFDMEYRGFYKRIYFRNCEIINHSDYGVFYIRKTENSGAYKALLYAKKKKIGIILV